jgi:hypothetical protein
MYNSDFTAELSRKPAEILGMDGQSCMIQALRPVMLIAR